MAFKLTDDQINGLRGKGAISNEYADGLIGKSGKEQADLIQGTAKAADKELKAIPLETDVVADKAAAYVSEAPALQVPNTPIPQTADRATLTVGGMPVDPNGPVNPPPAAPRPQTPAEAAGLSGPDGLDANGNVPGAGTDSIASVERTPVMGARTIIKAPQLQMSPQTGTPFITPEQQPVPGAKPAARGAGGPAVPQGPDRYLKGFEKDYRQQQIESGESRQNLATQAGEQQMELDRQTATAVAQQTQQVAALSEIQMQQREEENRIAQSNLDKLDAESRVIAETKIDPDRYWNNKSSGQKVLAGFAMFLGGIGQGASRNGGNKGASNMALDQMNSAIDRDLKAQEIDLKNSSNQLTERRGILAQRIQQFGNNELARTAAKQDLLQISQMQLRSLTANAASEQTRVKMEELQLGIQDNINKTKFDFSNLNQQRAAAQAAAAAASRAKYEARQYEDFKSRRDAITKAWQENPNGQTLDQALASGGSTLSAPSGKGGGDTRVDVGGEVVEARDKTSADAISKAANARDELRALTAEARQLRAEYGGETFPTAAKARMQQIQTQMALKVKDIAQLGALSGSDNKMLENVVPDLTEYSIVGTDQVAAKLDQLDASTERSFQSSVKTNRKVGSAQTPAAPKLDVKPNQ